VDGRVVSSDVVRVRTTSLDTRQKADTRQMALGTLPEDVDIMLKHVGDTIYN
jgi:hypothetical protein